MQAVNSRIVKFGLIQKVSRALHTCIAHPKAQSIEGQWLEKQH